jgi:hypothetical protein
MMKAEMSVWQAYLVWGLFIFGLIHLLRDFLQQIKVKIWLTSILVRRKSKAPKWYWLVFKSPIWIGFSVIFSVLAISSKSFYPFGLLSLICGLIFELAWVYYWIFLH